jgi:hypothetical protein
MAEVGLKSFDFTTNIFITTVSYNVQWQPHFSLDSPLVNVGDVLQRPWVQIQHSPL